MQLVQLALVLLLNVEGAVALRVPPLRSVNRRTGGEPRTLPRADVLRFAAATLAAAAVPFNADAALDDDDDINDDDEIPDVRTGKPKQGSAKAAGKVDAAAGAAADRGGRREPRARGARRRARRRSSRDGEGGRGPRPPAARRGARAPRARAVRSFS